MKALRSLLCTLILALGLAPLGLYFGAIARPLVDAGHPGIALVCMFGALAWYVLCLRALPEPQVRRP